MSLRYWLRRQSRNLCTMLSNRLPFKWRIEIMAWAAGRHVQFVINTCHQRAILKYTENPITGWYLGNFGTAFQFDGSAMVTEFGPAPCGKVA